MPTIVDPAVQLGGAWTSTRGLVNLLRAPPFDAEIVFVLPAELSPAAHRARRYLALAQSFVSGLPAKFQFHYSSRMLAEVERLLREKDFDVLFLNGSDLLWMLPHLPSGPARILFAHNIEHLLYADQINVQCPHWIIKKALLLTDYARLRQHELAGLQAVGNILFLSQEDERYAQRECPGLRTIAVPPLLNRSRASRADEFSAASGIEIGMLANFEWWPSQQGLRWFLREVHPHLHSGVRLHLFGNLSENVATNHPGVVKHGYVKDLDEITSTCHFMICPVFAGGGVSVKFADMICHGIPVLATRYATRGLPVEPDSAIVLLETASEWIAFLNSGAARELYRLSPSPQIIARFLPESHIDRFSHFLETVLSSSASAAK